ncbi:MAG TPA: HisA/HisF-related TIM barrel protein [Fimbriimonadaceae bacterium]|nr:HisA/HisF-related TIM barrel protein [Fimbriimonadaceae bacterium]
MIIPCIDVMGGKVVQLVKGERKAIELDSPDQAIAMFAAFPLLHVIDLDAALGRGDNRDLVRYLLTKVRARVGGGVRSFERALELAELGADQVIVGTAAFHADGVNLRFLESLAMEIGREKVVVAIDVKGGRITVKGWQQSLDLKPEDVLRELEPFCAGFLCTYVDREGMLAGTDLPFFLNLRGKTVQTLIAAGGITTLEEIRTLIEADIQVALGMAVYAGKLDLTELSTLQR